MQYEYQAEQLLINKMVLLLKEPKHPEEALSMPPPSPSPAPGSPLIVLPSALGGDEKDNKARAQHSPGVVDPSSAFLFGERRDATNGAARKLEKSKKAKKGGLLGLLRNKKNASDSTLDGKERAKKAKAPVPAPAPPPRPRVETILLQRPPGKDSKTDVRKALAMEAQRLRAQQQQQQRESPQPGEEAQAQPQPRQLGRRAERALSGSQPQPLPRTSLTSATSSPLGSPQYRQGGTFSPLGGPQYKESATSIHQDSTSSPLGSFQPRQGGTHSPLGSPQHRQGGVSSPLGSSQHQGSTTSSPLGSPQPRQGGVSSPLGSSQHQGSTTSSPLGSPQPRQGGVSSPLSSSQHQGSTTSSPLGSPQPGQGGVSSPLGSLQYQGSTTSSPLGSPQSRQGGVSSPLGSPQPRQGGVSSPSGSSQYQESATSSPLGSPQHRQGGTPSHSDSQGGPQPLPRGSALASKGADQRDGIEAQVKLEIQHTEQLLHAERTDQKPPLPRGPRLLLHKDKQPLQAAASVRKGDSVAAAGKTYCQSCKKKCSGEVLRVQDKYFHIACFKCKTCRNSLAQGGFFCKDGSYYCTADYQRQFGTKCAVCGEYVEGEVVSALGNTYHQKCFTCGRCRQPFPSGERVTYTGKEVLCARCVQIPVRDASRPGSGAASPSSAGPGAGPGVAGSNECAGCHEELKECQALIALDRQWHIWCFKCKACDAVLHGEYMGKDGVPYCENDYQKKFGVKCAYCSRYISGKVLQAGDNHHFHPTCARCTKCGDPFGDGEEMYLQGGAIWHPRCGPGPTENGAILNGVENGHCTDTETEAESGRDTAFDRMSSSAVSDLQFSIRSRTPSLNGSFNSLSRKYYHHPRTGSPGLILREYKQHQYPEDISRIYTYSYLTEEPTQGYLKRPINPYDKPPTSPHFHRPSSAASGRGSKLAHLSKHGSRTGMTVLVDSIRSETPRPRSPHMNNEEPIELAHFPAAKPPQPGEPPKIEREDFPAPPYPYTDPERRRRWSDSYKGVPISDDEDETDAKSSKETEDEKLKREEQELSKIATGIGKVFLHNVREREKLRQRKMAHIDPRNASRTPSAAREPTYRLRYQSPVNASPSRNVDHPRPWEEDDMLDRSSSYRSSVGRSVGAIPSYNVVSSLRSPPKPGYGLRSCTLPAAGRNGGFMGYPDQGDYSFSGLGEKTHSTEFSSGKSDISAGSISEVDRRALNTEFPVSTTYTGGLGALRTASYSPHIRRSLPNMTHSNSSEPPKIYPYHLLVITNYRLPADVDRCNLERHLSDAEFEVLFGCSRVEFYRLPQWRRNELKRRVRLF